jgi:hypothetical protein
MARPCMLFRRLFCKQRHNRGGAQRSADDVVMQADTAALAAKSDLTESSR